MILGLILHGVKWKGASPGGLAGGAVAEDLEEVAVDGELCGAREIVDQPFNWAAGEGNRRTTAGAEEMMPVTGNAEDVSRLPVGVEDPGQNIEGGQDFQRPVNRGPAECRRLASYIGDDLLSRERPVAGKNCGNYGPPGTSWPVLMSSQHLVDFRCGRPGRDEWPNLAASSNVHVDESSTGMRRLVALLGRPRRRATMDHSIFNPAMETILCPADGLCSHIPYGTSPRRR